MITEKGVLPIGVERDGKWHREFEVRPRLVKDTMEVAREQGMQKLENDIFFSLCLAAKQIIRIGDISPVPVEELLEMFDRDVAVITEAREKLAARLDRFHEGSEGRDATTVVGDASGEPDAATDVVLAQD